MTSPAHRCYHGHKVAPETPVGSCPRCDAIQRAEDARGVGVLETACAWHEPRPVLIRDGMPIAGPVPAGNLSHGICLSCRSRMVLTPVDSDPDGGFWR